jgi:hypothetical protein
MPRRLMRSIAWCWLVCQAAAVAAPLALCCPQFGIDEASCCPGVGPGQICPMHHTREGDRTCRMRNACGHHDSALLVLTAVGILRPAASVDSVSPIVDSIHPSAASTLWRAARPDLPPPRG